MGGWLKERVHLEILDRDGKILAVILSLGKGSGRQTLASPRQTQS